MEYFMKDKAKQGVTFTDFETVMLDLLYEYGCKANSDYEFDAEYEELAKLEDERYPTMYDKLMKRKLEIETNWGWFYTKHPSEMTDLERFGMEVLDPEEQKRIEEETGLNQ